MNNEVAVSNGNALDILNAQNNNTQAATELREMSQANWLPSLAVAYGTSKVVKDKKAYPGEFALGGQTNLGSSVEVVYLHYRMRASEFLKKDNSFGDSVFHLPSQGALRDNKVYNDFVNKKRDANVELQEGAEFLFYVVKQNAFVTMFCKKTLKGMIEPVANAGVGRLVVLTTRLKPAKKGGNDYYVVDVTPTSRALVGSTLQVPGTTISCDVDMPHDQFIRSYNIFNKPESNVAVTDDTPDLND